MQRRTHSLIAAGVAILLAFAFTVRGELSLFSFQQTHYQQSGIIGCGPAGDPVDIFKDGSRKMVPLPGCGNHQWKITTTSDSAQFYFNQGLNLFYSFHLEEARASFQEAQRHDSSAAMGYWGQSMAAGPIINSPAYDFTNKDILAALDKAGELATDKIEQALVKAQQLRYTPDKDADRKKMNRAYAGAMKELYRQYPDNTEIAVLYADALMMINPRDWYEKKTPKNGTDEIIALLEQIMAKNPDHPAALHYYIHIVEPSSSPERARDAADRLMPLLPSVAHMVHMPSHIYIITGDYKKGILSNEMALAGYKQFQQALTGWNGSRALYFYHNADMQGSNAMMMGNYEAAKKSFSLNTKQFYQSDTALYLLPGFGDYVKFMTVQDFLVEVRFGNWEKILASTEPASAHAYHRLLWEFGRGMAFAKTGRLVEARTALSFIRSGMNDPALYQRRDFRNRAIDAIVIASSLLEGTIAMAGNNKKAAIDLFSAAVVAEDSLRYSEPEDWRIPARHFLGQAYLLNGDFFLAQQVFETDLEDHPNNFWALNGLREALLRQQKKEALETLQKKYAEIFAAADIKLTGAVF